MNRSTRFLGLSLFASLGLAACGGAPGNNYNAPVASLQGTITAASISTPEQLHVALVWDHFDGDTGELKSAQEVGVRAEFPVRFKIDIATPPPEAAMNRVPADEAASAGFDPASFRFALGTVLVYEDGNANGTLDLLPLNATTSVDRPLGAAKPWLMYIEGTPPSDDAFGVHLVAGFNLVGEDPTACPVDANGEAPDFCRPKMTTFPLTTELEIALSNDPRLSALLCASGGGASSGGSGSGSAPGMGGMGSIGGTAPGTAPAFVPPPAGATITCAADKRSYTSSLCEQASLCSDTTCVSGIGQLQPGEAVPAGWPCM